MMRSLRHKLEIAEDDFLSALMDGGEAITTFERHWTKLLEDIDAANDAATLDSATAELAHNTSMRLAALADASADLLTSCDVLTAQLMDQMGCMMSELTLADPPCVSSTHRNFTAPPSTSPSGTSECSRGRKRRRNSDSTDIVPKRQRVVCDPVPRHSPTLPPPQYPTAPTSSTSFPSSSSRKRRLSDTDIAASALPLSKRLYVGPRAQAVSDSYVMLPANKGGSTTSLVHSSSQHLPSEAELPASLSTQDISPLLEPGTHDTLPLRQDTFEPFTLPDLGADWHVPAESLCELHGLDQFLTTLLEHSVTSTAPSEDYDTSTCPSMSSSRPGTPSTRSSDSPAPSTPQSGFELAPLLPPATDFDLSFYFQDHLFVPATSDDHVSTFPTDIHVVHGTQLHPPKLGLCSDASPLLKQGALAWLPLPERYSSSIRDSSLDITDLVSLSQVETVCAPLLLL